MIIDNTTVWEFGMSASTNLCLVDHIMGKWKQFELFQWGNWMGLQCAKLIVFQVKLLEIWQIFKSRRVHSFNSIVCQI